VVQLGTGTLGFADVYSSYILYGIYGDGVIVISVIMPACGCVSLNKIISVIASLDGLEKNARFLMNVVIINCSSVGSPRSCHQWKLGCPHLDGMRMRLDWPTTLWEVRYKQIPSSAHVVNYSCFHIYAETHLSDFDVAEIPGQDPVSTWVRAMRPIV